MISIRRECPEDTAAIRAINEAAFAQSAEADIVNALRDSCPDILSLVAETDDGIVGHILFSPVTIEDGPQSRQGMGPAPMAVMPNRQRRGIGSKLIDAGLTGVARYRDELDAAMSYLVWVEGRSPEEAIGLIHRGRPDAVPAWEAHHGCWEDRVVRYRPHI